MDREVDVSLRSVDVIHSRSALVPNLRFKQDAVPGLNIHMHFKPTVIGEYEIATCAGGIVRSGWDIPQDARNGRSPRRQPGEGF